MWRLRLLWVQKASLVYLPVSRRREEQSGGKGRDSDVHRDEKNRAGDEPAMWFLALVLFCAEGCNYPVTDWCWEREGGEVSAQPACTGRSSTIHAPAGAFLHAAHQSGRCLNYGLLGTCCSDNGWGRHHHTHTHTHTHTYFKLAQ